jgi:hypothetical protein
VGLKGSAARHFCFWGPLRRCAGEGRLHAGEGRSRGGRAFTRGGRAFIRGGRAWVRGSSIDAARIGESGATMWKVVSQETIFGGVEHHTNGT